MQYLSHCCVENNNRMLDSCKNARLWELSAPHNVLGKSLFCCCCVCSNKNEQWGNQLIGQLKGILGGSTRCFCVGRLQNNVSSDNCFVPLTELHQSHISFSVTRNGNTFLFRQWQEKLMHDFGFRSLSSVYGLQRGTHGTCNWSGWWYWKVLKTMSHLSKDDHLGDCVWSWKTQRCDDIAL